VLWLKSKKEFLVELKKKKKKRKKNLKKLKKKRKIKVIWHICLRKIIKRQLRRWEWLLSSITISVKTGQAITIFLTIKCLIPKETLQFIFFILTLDFVQLSVKVDTLLSNFKKLSPPKDSAFLTLKKESSLHSLLNSLTFSIKSLKI